ncbi:MAG: hypothetical protein PWQ82_611 [Thermosediminibacterales bacterium]|nr:hypothetical protein [Thermosediminibacterales bacterium]MDK2835537.1 hypothetical protein [Thermosediminibacterales bacterium]
MTGRLKLTKGDKILVAVIILISFASVLGVKALSSVYSDRYVVIESRGEPVKKILLGPNVEKRIVKVEGVLGYSVIEIGQDKVRMLDSPCPDHLCVKSGAISEPGQIIVCLPNQVVIKIIGDKGEVDASAF